MRYGTKNPQSQSKVLSSMGAFRKSGNLIVVLSIKESYYYLGVYIGGPLFSQIPI